MSIPRDLAVDIPGHGRDKINAAFENGGPRLTVRTIKKLFGDATGKDFPINNVISVKFGVVPKARSTTSAASTSTSTATTSTTTRAAASATRRSTSTPATRSSRARTRSTTSATATPTTTSSAPPASRTSCARRAASPGVQKLSDVGKRKKLARAFGRYFEVDRSFRSTKEIFSMLRLAHLPGAGEPDVNEVRFRAGRVGQPDGGHAAVRHGRDARARPSRVHEREELGQADADGEADPRGRGVRAPAQEAQPQQARRGRRAWRRRAPRASTRPCWPTRSSSSRSTSRRCARRAPPTRAPSRASTASATSRASSTRPTGWSSPRAWPASTTASRA